MPLPKTNALARSALAHARVVKRALARARIDDSALFSQSSVLLDKFADLLARTGNDIGALNAASLARLLEEKHRTMNGLKKRKRPWYF